MAFDELSPFGTQRPYRPTPQDDSDSSANFDPTQFRTTASLAPFGQSHPMSEFTKSPHEFPNNTLDYTQHLGKAVDNVMRQKKIDEANKAAEAQLKPWGTKPDPNDPNDKGNHPGFGGKLGHVLGTIGNVAGDALVPGIMADIPGSQANLNRKEMQGEHILEKEAGEAAAMQKAEAATTTAGANVTKADTDAGFKPRMAGVAEHNAETKDRGQTTNEQKPLNQLGTHEAAAFGAGQDPTADPTTQQAAGVVQELQKPSAEKTPPHITSIQHDGKAHIMERDPSTGEYSIDRGLAQPNYAQVAPSLKTIDVLDPQTNLPTIETLGGKKLGISATGAYGHSMEQAGAIGRMANTLMPELRAPQNRALLGHLSSYVTQGTLGTPVADAQAAKLSAELKSFAALQPALHGFRARTAQEAFENIIGGLAKNPDATIASIEGILKTAQAVNPNVQGPAAAPGGIQVIRDANGRITGIK